jgi:RNA polymerase sigma factor (sigma-70 family)
MNQPSAAATAVVSAADAQPPPNGASDAALLDAFARTRDQATFSQLVDRYINLVHAAARRQVGDAHLAEDITQAVFLLLSQRAGNIASSHQKALGGWLLLTTRNVALNALRHETRLKRREHEAAKMNSELDGEAALANSPEARSVAPLLDGALAKLTDDDRNAIVERFFHGGSHREVGRALGVSEEAATKRISRALGKLRAILERQGITANEATLSVVLPVIALKPAAPIALASAVMGTAASAAAPPAAVAALAKGAAAGAATFTGTTAAVAAGVMVVLATGVYVAVTTLAHKPSAPITPTIATPLAAVPAAPAPPAPPAAPAAAAGRTVTLTMVDPKTAGPIADAQVVLEVEGNARAPARADANGKFVLNLPANFQYARALISAPGRAAMSVDFQNYTFKGQLLSDYTVPMEAGTKIGGIVVDEAGEPVIGATITLSSYIRGPQDEPRPILRGEKVLTGADGSWSFDNAPSDTSLISIGVSHPDYPKNQPYAQPDKGQLLAGTWKRELKWQVGRSLDGVVLDPDGKPVAGATLVVCNDRYESNKPKATSDVDGKFHVTGIEQKWRAAVTATAPNFAPQQVQLPDWPDTAAAKQPYDPVEVHLNRGAKLEGVVVDSNGKPLSGAKIDVEKWRENRALTWSTKTDKQGHFIWANAPADEPIQFNVSKGKFATIQGIEITPSVDKPEPVKFTMYAPVKITGNVVDADTKEPIAAFRMIDGIRWTGQQDVTWQSQNGRSLSNGKYEANISDFSNGGRLRVEADGYLPQQSRMIEANEGAITIDFEMHKGSGPSGTVVDASGKPVMNIRVVAIPNNYGAYIDWQNDHLDDYQELIATRTDKDGHFKMRPPDVPHYSVIAVGEAGYISLKQDQLPSDGVLKLIAWGRIEGDLRLNASPLAKADVSGQTERGPYVAVKDNDVPMFNFQIGQTMTDEKGHFVLAYVPANEKVRVYRLVPMGGGSSRFCDLGECTVGPGQMHHISSGGHGRPVVAKLALPPTLNGQQISWGQQLSVEPVNAGGDSIASKVVSILTMTVPSSTPQSIDLIARGDGTVRADDVDPGTYSAVLVLRESWEKSRSPKELARATVNVTVPSTPACPTDEVLDVGTIQMKAP